MSALRLTIGNDAMLYVYPPKPLDLRSLGVGGRYLSSVVPQDGT
jgi:hypothetical protein